MSKVTIWVCLSSHSVLTTVILLLNLGESDWMSLFFGALIFFNYVSVIHNFPLVAPCFRFVSSWSKNICLAHLMPTWCIGWLIGSKFHRFVRQVLHLQQRMSRSSYVFWPMWSLHLVIQMHVSYHIPYTVTLVQFACHNLVTVCMLYSSDSCRLMIQIQVFIHLQLHVVIQMQGHVVFQIYMYHTCSISLITWGSF